MSIVFFTSGQPIPQPRPRVSTRGGFARAYVPRKHKVGPWKEAIRMAFVANRAGHALGHVTPIFADGPLLVDLRFTLPRPKSKTRKRSPNPRAPHATKPDLDNLEKAVVDALTGLAWHDDGQIAVLTASKHVAGDGDNPGVLVRIEQLPE